MNKVKIIILSLCCLTLISCPAGNYYKYEYIGEESIGFNGRFTELKLNDSTNIQILCGAYISFITKDQDKGLFAELRANQKSKLDIKNANVKVISSKIGNLKKTRSIKIHYLDSLNNLVFDKKINLKKQKQLLRLVQNDTITFEFENGMKYQFVNRN